MNQYGTSEFYLTQCESLNRQGFQARVYGTSDLAIYDLSQSMIHAMPHKNKIAVVSAGTHLVDVVTAVALKNQQQILIKKPGENIITFLENLDSSTHFVFWTNQHQLTSENIYNEKQIEEIIEVCHRKKIFSLCVLGISSECFLKKAELKDQTQYSVFVEASDLFSFHKEATAYLSSKLKLQLLTSTLQNKINFDAVPLKNTHLKHFVYTAKESSALAIKEYLNLNDQQAMTLAEYPFWITDKWSSWWPEIKNKNYIKDTLLISEEFFKSRLNFEEELIKADQYIKSVSSWKII